VKAIGVPLVSAAVLSCLSTSLGSTSGTAPNMNQYEYRVPLRVGAGRYERLNKPVEEIADE
jgi:hypothetical protein